MTQASLRAVTLKTLANYAQAAERAVDAYRFGGHRLISVMQRGVDRAAVTGAERLVPRIAKAVRQAAAQAGGAATQGVDVMSRGTERVIERSTKTVSAQLERMADLVDGMDNALVAGTVQATVRMSMPGAQAALALSERVAKAVDKLPRAKPARPASAARGAKARKAAKAVEAPVEAVVKAVKTVKKAAAKPVAAVRKAAAKPMAAPAAPVRARRAAKPAKAAPAVAPEATAAEAA